MDEKDCELLLELKQSKNITKTAQKLFITQPALTKRIQKIEEELQCQLLLVFFLLAHRFPSLLSDVRAASSDRASLVLRRCFCVSAVSAYLLFLCSLSVYIKILCKSA